MVYTFLSGPLFVETILPFLLVFTLVFAILQKTEILGKGKKQIDALVAFVIGLVVISFSYATGIIISLIPLLAVGAVIVLIFLLLYGMVFEPGKFEVANGIKIAVGILAAIAVIIATMVATGAWSYVIDSINSGDNGSMVIANLIFIGVIAVAVVIAMFAGGKSDKK